MADSSSTMLYDSTEDYQSVENSEQQARLQVVEDLPALDDSGLRIAPGCMEPRRHPAALALPGRAWHRQPALLRTLETGL
jgi:hypothetical protein